MNDQVMKFNWFLNKIKNGHDRVLEFSSSICAGDSSLKQRTYTGLLISYGKQ